MDFELLLRERDRMAAHEQDQRRGRRFGGRGGGRGNRRRRRKRRNHYGRVNDEGFTEPLSGWEKVLHEEYLTMPCVKETFEFAKKIRKSIKAAAERRRRRRRERNGDSIDDDDDDRIIAVVYFHIRDQPTRAEI